MKNITIHEINQSWNEKISIADLKSLAFGLRPGGQDAVCLYILACKICTDLPFELKKVAAHCIDAAHSISRNISAGYCRRSLKAYLNHLNFALGSCAEFHSCYVSFKQAGQISDDDYEQLDKRPYKVENELLKLIESLQRKQKEEVWEDTFPTK